jgi:hypothetical protein
MPDPKPEEYLAMAEQAERAAGEATSDIAKNTWRAMAREYREMAAEALRRTAGPRKSRR